MVAGTLRAALEAGCEDLVECASLPHCPLPFGGLPVDGRAAASGDFPSAPPSAVRWGVSKKSKSS